MEVIALKKSISFLMGFCALIVAVALVSVGVTLAIWSGSTRETNVVTIGNVRIELIDEYEGGVPEFEPSNEVTISKKVSVKNIGNNKCYVRVLVAKGWYDSDGNLDTSVSKDFIDPVYDTTGHWVKGTPVDNYEGYDVYYYQEILDPGATAAKPLFEKFYFLKTIGEEGSGDEVVFDTMTDGGKIGRITVLAQAVQSEYLGQEGTDFGLKRTGGKITGWPNDLVFN